MKDDNVIAQTCVSPAPEAKLQIIPIDRHWLKRAADVATVHIEAESVRAVSIFMNMIPLDF